MEITCLIAGIPVNISYLFDDYFAFNLEMYLTAKNPTYWITSEIVSDIPSLTHPFMNDRYRQFFHIEGNVVIQAVDEMGRVRYQIKRTPDYRHTIITQCESMNEKPAEKEYIFISMVFMEIALREGYVSLHASSVIIDEKAYLFSAPSKTGKSTHANYYLAHFARAFILNDDKPIIKDYLVYGSPFSGKTKKNRNASYPLKAITFISQGYQDSIRKLSKEEAMPLLMKNIARPNDESVWDLVLPNINHLLETVDFFEATLTMDSDNVYMTYFEPNKEKILKLKPGFMVKKNGQQFGVFPMGEDILTFNRIISLNKMSTFLFEVLNEEHSLEELVKLLADCYNVTEVFAKKEVIIFLDTLQLHDLLE